MEYRLLGSTGIKVSLLSLGTLNFDDPKRKDTYTELVRKSIEKGVNFIDTSEAYSGNKSEELLGYSLKKLEIPRENIVISTKIFYGKGFGHPHSNPQINSLGLSRKHIIESTRISLKRLGTNYIDVVFCHRFDPETPLEETCRAMNWLIENGMALHWGTCEWRPAEVIKAHEICEKLRLIPPAVEQIQYNYLDREKLELEYLPVLDGFNRKACVWSLLGGGLLAESPLGKKIESRNSLFEVLHGKKAWTNTEELEDMQTGIKQIVKQLNCTLSEFSIAWGLKHPDISTAIMGWKKSLEIDEALNAISKIPMITNEIESQINSLLHNRPKGDFNWKNMQFEFKDKRLI